MPASHHDPLLREHVLPLLGLHDVALLQALERERPPLAAVDVCGHSHQLDASEPAHAESGKNLKVAKFQVGKL